MSSGFYSPFVSHSEADHNGLGTDIGDSFGHFGATNGEQVTSENEMVTLAWTPISQGSDLRVKAQSTVVTVKGRALITVNATLGLADGAFAHSTSRVSLFIGGNDAAHAYGQHSTSSGGRDRMTVSLTWWVNQTSSEQKEITVGVARYGGASNLKIIDARIVVVAS